ncbi:MAG: dephospho-CoA kinase [Actinomycetota bacterium]|nr:dephospho-CoA kinase [Actinomycetota bacterium]
MLLVGLTGGLGSGKSTVARLLADRGAVVIDADVLARRALDPGTHAYHQAVELFGEGILAPDGTIDRAALAAVVFADEEKRRSLESLTHPEVFRQLAETVETLRGTDSVVVFDAALIVETGFHEVCDVLVVVTARVELQVERVMRDRGMERPEAEARIAMQLSPDRREEVADHVIRNESDLHELERQVDLLWANLREREASRGEPPISSPP